MSGPIKNVILVGASGNIGKPVLEEFISSGHYKISVLTRESSSATFPSSVHVIKTDYSAESVEKAFQGQDAVVSLVGAAALGDQQKLVDAAVKAGVKRFLPSEYGADTSNKAVQAKVPIFGAKTATVEYLRSKEKDGLSWTGLVTGPFFDWGLGTGFLGFKIKEKRAEIWDGGNVKFSSTNLPTIGKAIVSLLSTPERLSATENKYVFVASHTVTQNEVLAAFEKASGEWSIERVHGEKAGEKAREGFSNGDYSTIPNLIRTAFLTSDELGNNEKKGLSNDVLGLPKEDLGADIKRAVSA